MSTSTNQSNSNAGADAVRASLPDGLVYVSGAFRSAADATVSVFDHGLLYGDGVFEGIRAYNGRVFKLERHVERLFDSAKAIRLAIPHTPSELCDIVLESCRRNAIVDGYLRVVVTRGPGDLGVDPRKCPRAELIVIVKPTLSIYAAPSTGIRLVTSTFRRNSIECLSPAIKSLNYLNNVLARIEANDRGADEALMLDMNGFVAEATVDNFFIVTDHALVTPPTATNLKGVTRETILAVAASLGIRTEEKPIALFDAWTTREAFICGTAAEVVPVISIDDRVIGSGAVGAVTGRIVTAYHDLVRSQGTPIHASRPSQELAASFKV
ncbi:MAG: branched-chain-amino-acid transaminase [Acidobacteria bacterium]|nr:MAG: branched-chain-amino-acid transaminase [Acidobacteriota bacterium]PYQ89634.1 MAG: branched-chain-amino-acid transaminase [Acidobacteriota bacterium]PYR05172.1 MAG: branched-chain-amino-acid transaminase [Acidobacteriota bacterium]